MIAIVRKYESEYDSKVERITITIDAKTLKSIRVVAGPRGVSKFIAQAVREKLGRNEFHRWIEEMNAKYGTPSKKLVDEIDRDMRKIFGIK